MSGFGTKCLRLAAVALAASLTTTPARADGDEPATRTRAVAVPVPAPVPVPAYSDSGSTWTFGLKYWYSTGRIGYNYYNDRSTAQINSRLTYDRLTTNSGEITFRGSITDAVYVKGALGYGGTGSGKLYDEDFPPAITPYTRTRSEVNGDLNFAHVDIGYNILRSGNDAVARGGSFRLGPFLGLAIWREQLHAMGCTQIAGNPNICVPTISVAQEGIRETDLFTMGRFGIAGDVWLSDRIRLSAEAAYVLAHHAATDIHFFTFGSDPGTGSGKGLQVEAGIDYRLTDTFSMGVGGRWWHLESSAVESFNQLMKYETDRYGVTVHGEWRL
ncbi:MAG: hypothetical protein K1X57_22630 [Gemmataceae bacterium]|nr:hypothetical protein [Gemmataceae bacterium]